MMKFIGSLSLVAFIGLPLPCFCEAPFEKWTDAVASQWQEKGPANAHSTVRLQIALSSSNDEDFEQRAIDIATPGSAHYRKHLSPDQVSAWMQPSQQSVQKVKSWLERYGISSVLDNDVLIADDTPISKVESALKTEYKVFEDLRSGDQTVRTEEYYVPEELHTYIDLVTPTVHFPVLKRSHSHTAKRKQMIQERSEEPQLEEASTDEAIQKACGQPKSPHTPACIRALYKIDGYKATNKNNAFAIHAPSAGFSEKYLQTYLKEFNPPAYKAGATFEIVKPVNDTFSGFKKEDEPNLDTQLSLGLAWPAKAIYYLNTNYGSFYVGKTKKPSQKKQEMKVEDDFFTFLHKLVYGKIPHASVVSESTGSNEQQVTRAEAKRYCRMFAAIGARGITYLWASGDNGAQGYQDFTSRNTVLAPTWPASCPFVTSVGGSSNPLHEVSATFDNKYSEGLSSSGGFSNYFPRPKYQANTVPAYIQNNLSPVSAYKNLSGFNEQGRGIPDISAIGAYLAYIDNPKGKTNTASGTSAAAPLVAAIIALLNDYEANRGNPPLGFLNPWLYSLKNGQGVKDITKGGSNWGLGGYYPEPVVPKGAPHKGGYPTAAGWDAVTGLGSLDFGMLVKNLP